MSTSQPNRTLTLIPDDFLPIIGEVMVQHAFMDSQLQSAICLLAGMDYNTGVSVLAPVITTRSRAEMLQNLARTKAMDLPYLCKLLVLGDVVVDLSVERNIVAHTLPYSYSPSKDELHYFKEVNKTRPQIRQTPPYVASKPKLEKLAQNMQLVGFWLMMLTPHHMPDDFDTDGMTVDQIRSAIGRLGTRHPHWEDDARFPWQDKFRGKVQSESQKPLNSQRKPKGPPKS